MILIFLTFDKITSFINIMNNISNMRQEMTPKIARTRFQGGNKFCVARSLVVTIPHEYARAYYMKEPTNVILTPTDKGILISKLEIKQ
jgi:hypothetical protein